MGVALGFTGHRPASLPWGYDESQEDCIKLKELLMSLLTTLINEQKVSKVIVGMALGCDTYMAESVLLLNESKSDIFLECALPFEEQAAAWTVSQRERYFSIIERSDKETLIQNQFTKDCYTKRNSYIVEKSDILLAVWNGTPRSGTSSTINMAKKKGIEIIIVNPASLEILRIEAR